MHWNKWVRRILLAIQQILLKLSERSYIEVVVSRKNFLNSTLEVLSIFASNPIIGFGASIVGLSIMSIYTTGITTIHYCYCNT
ncbi:hypothetical protein MXB_525 [Myxobolus squamalis]|nr:hypothetical protein MXB_525 [Myxobolus squamalis]